MSTTVIPLTPEGEERERAALRRHRNARPTVAPGGVIARDVDGVEVTTRGACVFVTVRGSADARRELERFCRRHGLTRELYWEGEDTTGEYGQTVRGLDVWKVVGDPSALATLAEPNHVGRLWWVKEAELGMNARVGGRAAGGGELSEGAARRLRVARQLRLKDGEAPPTERVARAAFPAVLAANGLRK